MISDNFAFRLLLLAPEGDAMTIASPTTKTAAKVMMMIFRIRNGIRRFINSSFTHPSESHACDQTFS